MTSGGRSILIDARVNARPGAQGLARSVLKLTEHMGPSRDGLAPRIANLPEWRAHLLTRLHRQAGATGDARLAALHTELAAYPGGEGRPPRPADVVVPLRYRGGGDTELSFISITAVVGTPMDVTVEELAIESFYPADDTTAAALTPGGTGRDARFASVAE